MSKINNSDVFCRLPARKSDSNKGTYGTLTCICGSARFRGAASLAVSAAMRCGAGIVRLASVERVIEAAASKLSECVFEPLAENPDGSIGANNIETLLRISQKSSAVLCGCGMSMCADTAEITRALIENCRCQLILDADALNSTAEFYSPELLRKCAVPAVITPHIGEMSRLSGRSVAVIKADRAGAALEFAQKYGCVTVLKDDVTHVALPGGKVRISSAGNAGLAKGGSGDLLAGMLSSFCAQGMDSGDASICAVHLHGMAADLCARRLSMRGMLPSDILYDLCGIFAGLESETSPAV